ncbi:hypothetical protein HWV62_6205 [Athelia sp. TMB]|nr:hypothetical protein HWV62_6205 [Athelia sp. TMB]
MRRSELDSMGNINTSTQNSSCKAAALSIRAFLCHPLELTELLAYDRALTRSRYFRLAALAMAQTLYTTPLAVLVICLRATTQPIVPWVGLAANHQHLSRVDLIPAAEWRQDRGEAVELELARWAAPFCVLVFFALFGFAEEARAQYCKAIQAVVRPLGFSGPSADSSPVAPRLKPQAMSAASSGSLSVFAAKRPTSGTSSLAFSCGPSTTTASILRASDLSFLPPTPSTTSTTPYTHHVGLSPRSARPVSQESFCSRGAGHPGYEGPIVL